MIPRQRNRSDGLSSAASLFVSLCFLPRNAPDDICVPVGNQVADRGDFQQYPLRMSVAQCALRRLDRSGVVAFGLPVLLA